MPPASRGTHEHLWAGLQGPAGLRWRRMAASIPVNSGLGELRTAATSMPPVEIKEKTKTGKRDAIYCCLVGCSVTFSLEQGMRKHEDSSNIISLISQSSGNRTEEHRKTYNMTFNSRQETWGRRHYK